MTDMATPENPASDRVRTSILEAYHRNPRVGNVPLIVDSLKAHGQYKPLIVNRGTLTGRPNEVLAGNHLLQAGLQLICGDSTHADVIATVTEGAEIDAMWTDPPYGVDYVSARLKTPTPIKNDTRDGLAELLLDAFTAALPSLRPGAPCYVAAPSGPDQYGFYTALTEAGYLVRQVLVWVKNIHVLGRSDYHYKHEPILVAEADADDVSRETSDAEAAEEAALESDPIVYGFTPGGKGRLGRGGDHWFGNNKQNSVFEIPKPPASREHPTMKPTELIVQHLRNSVARKGTVLDLFAGSGSTIIAAHRLNLAARAVEIDPRLCDIICRRYQEHTGTRPILERTGEPVTFVPEGT